MIEISEVSIDQILPIYNTLPEFSPPLLTSDQIAERMTSAKKLILLARYQGQNAGFKVGYERGNTFYSWLGGVLPAYRRKGIASALAEYQEGWARVNGFKSITFKTRNAHRNMLLFGIRNGFQIIDFQAYEAIRDHQILLRKML